MNTEHKIRKFDKQSVKYERMRGNDPLKKYRHQIFKDAEGEVLELSIGVGSNFQYYKNVDVLTGVDFSPEMLKRARRESQKYEFNAKMLEVDIETIEFEDDSFDTIVSSLGFCGYQDPVGVMNKLSGWCRPDGKVLLLEHGVSTFRPLGLLQKMIDPLALKMVGCHQKRDIAQLVDQSDLEIVRIKRYAAGCVYLIWALPKRCEGGLYSVPV